MTNIQSKSLIPFCLFIDKSVIHVSIFYMHCVRQLLIHFLYIDAYMSLSEVNHTPMQPNIYAIWKMFLTSVSGYLLIQIHLHFSISEFCRNTLVLL